MMESLVILFQLWRSALLGSGLLVVGMVAGMKSASFSSVLPVRLVAVFVGGVVLPLIRSPVWWRRAAGIFFINISVLAALVLLGRSSTGVIVALAGLGTALGIAVHLVVSTAAAVRNAPPEMPAHVRRRVSLGLLLNVLEPVAIFAAVGLALGREPTQLHAATVWKCFLYWIAPTMLIATAGEALWVGELRDQIAPVQNEKDAQV